jgi:hypothetical protein
MLFVKPPAYIIPAMKYYPCDHSRHARRRRIITEAFNESKVLPTLQCTSARTVIGLLAASRLSTSIATPQLMLQRTNATIVIVYSEASKFSTNTSAPL